MKGRGMEDVRAMAAALEQARWSSIYGGAGGGRGRGRHAADREERTPMGLKGRRTGNSVATRAIGKMARRVGLSVGVCFADRKLLCGPKMAIGRGIGPLQSNQIIAPADRVHAIAMAQPPDLIDDAATEILLRLPPNDPACLVRASLVCKAWRELLSGPAFLRRYRAFHSAPPMLGFLRNVYDEGPCARFVATDARASPFSTPAFGCRNWWFLECRHGRVLVQSFERPVPTSLFVWDPITGDRQLVPEPTSPPVYSTAAVLCGVDGCDHLNCHGGPFLVVFICNHHEEGEEGSLISACIYTSETGAWTRSPTIQFSGYIEERSSLLARDALYFTLQEGERILKYDFVGQCLQVIDAPDMFEQVEGIIVAAEDGGLGVAGIMDGNLHLWSWQASPSGVAEWVQGRVVKLSTLLPTIEPLTSSVIGFQEGTDTIFVSTDVGVFAVMTKSEQVKKVGERGSYHAIAPYMSFYTPDLIRGRLPPP